MKREIFKAVSGYMPVGRHYGFIYNEFNNTRTIAHELGHGTNTLHHTFSDDSESFHTTAKTDNLMDYNGGTALNHKQWQWSHEKHRNVLGFLDGEGESENISLTGEFLIKATDNTIYGFDVKKGSEDVFVSVENGCITEINVLQECDGDFIISSTDSTKILLSNIELNKVDVGNLPLVKGDNRIRIKSIYHDSNHIPVELNIYNNKSKDIHNIKKVSVISYKNVNSNIVLKVADNLSFHVTADEIKNEVNNIFKQIVASVVNVCIDTLCIDFDKNKNGILDLYTGSNDNKEREEIDKCSNATICVQKIRQNYRIRNDVNKGDKKIQLESMEDPKFSKNQISRLITSKGEVIEIESIDRPNNTIILKSGVENEYSVKDEDFLYRELGGFADVSRKITLITAKDKTYLMRVLSHETLHQSPFNLGDVEDNDNIMFYKTMWQDTQLRKRPIHNRNNGKEQSQWDNIQR